MIFRKKPIRYQLSEKELERLESHLPLAVKIGTKRICLIKLKDERFVAFKNKCPHAGARLDSGWLSEEGSLVCPTHRFTFDLKTGQSSDGEGLCLNLIDVSVEGSVIKII